MLEKCFGDNALKLTTVREWHGRFKSGRNSINYDDRSGRPSTSKTDENIGKIKDWMAINRKLTIREMAEELDIAFGTVQDILANDLGFRRVAANSRDEIIEKSKMALMAIPRADFKKCFEDWIKRWHKCVAVYGEYFEGDNIDFDE
ncbi:protein GVQW3-like [Drosophila elegans]|uniref:protein GVQW3-like n=1 Tax=Drosophila elegans TaxID=30023 RepID=UPI001BC82D1B|nr:protein GVQW3-like [Drosophila elegans]